MESRGEERINLQSSNGYTEYLCKENKCIFGILLLFKNRCLCKMICFPNAKVNIGLKVLAKRSDGFHDLETIFYPLALRDVLEIVESSELAFSSSGINIPGDASNNLCIRAYQLIAADFDIPPVQIHLHKNIPIGAGLGGGSADATFMVGLLNDKFKLSLDSDQLKAYASQLGSDCAFFVDNVTSLASGRGEILRPIHLDLSEFNIVLVMPPVHVSTADAFRGIVPSDFTKSLGDLIAEPVPSWKENIVNDFETSVFSTYPQIKAVKTALYEAGALYASMSGTGASVYGLFRSEVDLSDLETDNGVYYRL